MLDLISVSEAAAILRCSTAHARRLVLTNLRCYRPGGAKGKLLVDRQELIDWIEASAVAPSRKPAVLPARSRRVSPRPGEKWLDVLPDGRIIV